MATLEIEGVDLDLLEEQRRHLINLAFSLEKKTDVTNSEIMALDGIINMLDAWSDKRAKEVRTNGR